MSGQKSFGLWPALLLFLVPLGVRAAVWRELTQSPFFDVLFVDARFYHEIAKQMSSSSYVHSAPHWQPPFYPMFLSQLYSWFGANPDVGRAAGALLGSLSAVLVFLIGRRFFGSRAGWVAWALVAFSGPMIFFDLQLLNASLGVALTLGCLWLFSRAACLQPLSREPRRSSPDYSWPAELGRVSLAGFFAGLAAITIGNMLLLGPALVGGALLRGLRREAIFGVSLATFLLAAALPPAVVSLQNYEVSGEWVGISYNSGINFWIGNNPDYDQTVAVRPGRAWAEWMDEPRKAGATGYAEQSDYFFAKSRTWFKEDPGAALRLQLKKLRLFLRGDEIMRNQEIYPFRGESKILASLLWSREVAAPFGLLFPVAMAALVSLWSERHRFSSRWRVLPPLLLVYVVSVLAFFVTARYRLPIVPLLAILAGGGATLWIERFVRGPWGSLALPTVVATLFFVVAAQGVPKASKEFNSDAYYDLGVHLQSLGDFETAAKRYEQALERNPKNYEALNNLAGVSLRIGDLARAEKSLRLVLSGFPDDLKARYNLGLVYLDQGKPYEAGWEFHRVLRAVPGHPRAKEKLAAAEALSMQSEMNRLGAESRGASQALLTSFRANPTNGFLHQRLRTLLKAEGREAEAAEIDRLFAETATAVLRP